jgi:DNA-binding transcriptional LysR family regulator
MRSDWLDAFLVFSECLNFTRAAEALHISQPALHVKIGKLADGFGEPLYRRAGRALVLTRAGEELAVFARDQKARADAFVEQLKTGASHQPVELCAGEGAYLYLLGPAIARFLERAASGLHLITGDRDRTVELVLAGRAHLGVTALDAEVSGITAEPLTRVGQMLVVPRHHRLAPRDAVTLSDLDGEALIVPPRGRPHRVMLERLMMDANVSWSVAVEAQGWELMLHFAGLGLGLAVVNGSCQIPPGLVALPMPELPAVQYHVLQRSSGLTHAGAAVLRDLLLQCRDSWRD